VRDVADDGWLALGVARREQGEGRAPRLVPREGQATGDEGLQLGRRKRGAIHR
jgi:hypothetical protein